MAFSLITDGEDNCVDWLYSFPKQRGDRVDVMNLSSLLYLWRYKTLNEQTLTNDLVEKRTHFLPKQKNVLSH